MEYILNLAEAEFILQSVESSGAVPFHIDLAKLHTKLKKGIKNHTNSQNEKIEHLVNLIGENGHGNTELTKLLSSAKEAIASESLKTRDKYFDSEGNEKKK